jgi:hypothetical protein
VQSHAHAQIFGFAAMFIFGISYHVMPRFMGVPLQNVTAAWTSFGLLLGGMILRCLSHKDMAGHPPHRGEDPLIFDPARDKLFIHHPVTELFEIGH